jgi:Na(+)-translocating NADH:ubiquinone oxidoreductase C subunit
MKKGFATVGFMVIVSVAFITVLASVNEVTKARITRNFEIEKSKSLLYAFNIFPQGFDESQLSLIGLTADIPWQEDQVLKTKESRLRLVKIPMSDQLKAVVRGSFLEGREVIEIFEGINDKGDVVAYGLPLVGKGLWGTIEGFGVISADLSKMVGIDFTKQSETPGLGARIIQQEYRSFFRNLDLSGFSKSGSNQPPVIMVKKKEKTNVAESTNSVQAITGATQTSQGVLDMVNSNLNVYLKILQEYQKTQKKA